MKINSLLLIKSIVGVLAVVFAFVLGLQFRGDKSYSAQNHTIPDSSQDTPETPYEIPYHPNDKIAFPNRAEIARREKESLKYLNSRGIHLQNPMPSRSPISHADRQAAKEIYDAGISDEIEITIIRE